MDLSIKHVDKLYYAVVFQYHFIFIEKINFKKSPGWSHSRHAELSMTKDQWGPNLMPPGFKPRPQQEQNPQVSLSINFLGSLHQSPPILA